MIDSNLIVWPQRFRAAALLGTASLLTLAVACQDRPSGSERQEIQTAVSATLSADEFCAAWAEIRGARDDQPVSEVQGTPQDSVDSTPKHPTDEPRACPPCSESPQATPKAPERRYSAPPSSEKGPPKSDVQRVF